MAMLTHNKSIRLNPVEGQRGAYEGFFGHRGFDYVRFTAELIDGKYIFSAYNFDGDEIEIPSNVNFKVTQIIGPDMREVFTLIHATVLYTCEMEMRAK